MVIFLTVVGFIMIAFSLFGPSFWGWLFSILFFAVGVLFFALGRVYSLLSIVNDKLDKINKDK